MKIEKYERKFSEEVYQELRESKEFVIFKDNEPFEVVDGRKESQYRINSYRTHPGNKNSSFSVKPLSKVEDLLRKLKPKSYQKLQKILDLSRSLPKGKGLGDYRR
jgi:hypothetical protein